MERVKGIEPSFVCLFKIVGRSSQRVLKGGIYLGNYLQ
jgi:hypothetical protein